MPGGRQNGIVKERVKGNQTKHRCCISTLFIYIIIIHQSKKSICCQFRMQTETKNSVRISDEHIRRSFIQDKFVLRSCSRLPS